MEPSGKRWLGCVGRHLKRALVAGIVAIVPLGVTMLVLWWLFERLDSIFQPLLSSIFGRSLPGMGLMILILVIYSLGVITTNVFGRRLVRALDAVMTRIPIVQLVYSAVRHVATALKASRATPFNRVVIVEFPRKGMQSIAFVTGRAIDVDGEKKFPLYVPTAPNPTSGHLVMMPSSEITSTDITVEEALSMVVSSGLVMPRKIKMTSV